MNQSGRLRPPALVDEPRPIALATKRHCDKCSRMADLIDLSPNGTALYVCPNQHQILVDVSKAIQMR